MLDIQAGADHTFVLLSSGRVLGFGDNAFGVLGLGKKIKSVSTPTEVPGLTAARHRRVSCWGKNTAGQLGDGTSGANESKTQPVHVRIP